MLTEDVVVRHVRDHLAANGWEIVSLAMPNQRGTDVVATRAGIRLEVEAKGVGSSKSHTARYRKEFTQPQVTEKLGAAVLKALAVVSAGRARAAIALPDTALYRRLLTPVLSALRQLEVTIFGVQDDGRVASDCSR